MTMRLIDLFFYEFLLFCEKLCEGVVNEMFKYIYGKLVYDIIEIVESMCEYNLMFGFRGCRLGCVKFRITRM